jgi:hypothetical protein
MRLLGHQGTMTKRVALTIFYLDSAGFAGVMKAGKEDSGKALKSCGLAKWHFQSEKPG